MPNEASVGPLSLADVCSRLASPIPDRFIKEKRKGGADIRFVSWYDLQRMLDHNTNGFWEAEVVNIESAPYKYQKADREGTTVVGGTKLFVTVRIIITTQEGKFGREATGNCDYADGGWGDVSSNAEAMAFRRCCAKWGLGLDMWIKEDY